jgi:lysozyme
MANINLLVVDIYHLDRVTSFKNAAQSGIRGVIHKATTGATGTDSQYAARRQAAVQAGLLWGAYHWGTAADVGAQVKNFLASAKPDPQTLVALDFEPSGSSTMSLAQARDFLTRIENALGRKAVLYSNGLIKSTLGNKVDPFFGAHRLWLAHFNPTPVVQASWKKFWLWQYTDSKKGLQPNTVPGIPGDSNGNLDCNSYDGTAAQLAQEWAS